MIVNGFKCLKCLSTVFVEYYTFRQDNGRVPSNDSGLLKRTDKCKCSNCAIILDLDGIIHLYCDDISTLVVCRVDTNNPSDSEILQSSLSWFYQDYYPISSTKPLFTDTKKKALIDKQASKPQLSKLQKSFKVKDKKDKHEKSKTRNKT